MLPVEDLGPAAKQVLVRVPAALRVLVVIAGRRRRDLLPGEGSRRGRGHCRGHRVGRVLPTHGAGYGPAIGGGRSWCLLHGSVMSIFRDLVQLIPVLKICVLTLGDVEDVGDDIVLLPKPSVFSGAGAGARDEEFMISKICRLLCLFGNSSPRIVCWILGTELTRIRSSGGGCW